MRKHPLLAFLTATVALATTGVLEQSALASRTIHPSTAASRVRSRLDLAALAVARPARALPSRSYTGLSGTIPLTFAVTGGPVLGSYLPPAVRRHEIAAQRGFIRHRARLAALHREQYVPSNGVWAELRACESGGNYGENSGNGYYGAYQFAATTWWGIGFPGMPNNATPAVQDHAAQMLQIRSGWGAWPLCSQILGLG